VCGAKLPHIPLIDPIKSLTRTHALAHILTQSENASFLGSSEAFMELHIREFVRVHAEAPLEDSPQRAQDAYERFKSYWSNNVSQRNPPPMGRFEGIVASLPIPGTDEGVVACIGKVESFKQSGVSFRAFRNVRFMD
jgi:hypothetical protein